MEGINLTGKTLEDLRYIAKMMGIKNLSRYKKNELIEVIYKSGNGMVEGFVSSMHDSSEASEANNLDNPKITDEKEKKSKDANKGAVDKLDVADTNDSPVVLRKSKRGRPKANKVPEVKSEPKAEKDAKDVNEDMMAEKLSYVS